MIFPNTPPLLALVAITLSAMAVLPAAGQVINEDAKLLPSDGAAGDEFGWSVAISGNTAVVGAYQDEDNGDQSGSAYLFDTTTGQQLFKLRPSDGAESHRFGWSVAISGTTAVVGAVGNDENGVNSGSAYLFDTTTGQQLFKLVPDDGRAGDNFGVSVAISGTTAVVGAYWDVDNGIWSGSAYLFDTTTGQQIAKLLPSDGDHSDQFGYSVAISGNTAVVGAYQDEDNGDQSGSAYLFDTTTGQQLFKLVPDDGRAGDRFGFSVAISGTTAVVGAYGDDDNGGTSGSAYLFDTSTGQQLFKLLPSDGAAVDYFGYSVAISGTTAVVGAINSGSAYLFDTTTGQQLFKLLPSDRGNDLFGFSVAISGTTAVVGAKFDDDNGAESGSAYVFGQAEQDAAFIVHAVHGQVPGEFIPFTMPGAPTWLQELVTPMSGKVQTANEVRLMNGINGSVSIHTASTDWSVGTGEGTPLIATSRLLQLSAPFLNLNPILAAARDAAADAAEEEGRRRTGVASRQAGAEMFNSLRDQISLIRAQEGPDFPIFLDIISHSRGTTVTSEALRLLADDPISDGPLEVNVVYLDAIDSSSSEPDLPRPLARAGHLMNDPLVMRRAGELVHHLVSECAATCSSPTCLLDDVWFFTGPQLCELRDLGLDITDTALASVGYPQGHLRPYLMPDFEQVVLGSTHTSVVEDFVDSAVEIVPGDTQLPPAASFGSRTALGQFLTFGLLDTIPDPIPFSTGRFGRYTMASNQPLISDPDFELAGELTESVEMLLSDVEINSLLTPAFQPTRELLEDIAEDSLNIASAWNATGDTELREVGDSNSIVTVFAGDVSQNVTTPSPQNDTWRVSTQLVLFQNGGVATIEIETDQGITQLMDFDTNRGDPSAVLISADELFTWDAEGDVTIRATGNGFNLHSLNIELLAACIADFNGDAVLNFFDVSLFLGAYTDMYSAADLNNDGVYNFFDVSQFLAAYTAGCP